VAADCGLKFQDESIDHAEGGWRERHGYELFMRMWGKGKHPDGIMVADDILCHGVLRAIQERQVALPRDLRLVTQANRGSDFPYHRPMSRVEFDLDAWADKALRMLETLTRGQPLANTVELMQAKLEKGETT
jgi:DNA-binding LacI/PurR family transcriptional regulator